MTVSWWGRGLDAALVPRASLDHVDRLRHAHGQAFRDVVRAMRGDRTGEAGVAAATRTLDPAGVPNASVLL